MESHLRATKTDFIKKNDARPVRPMQVSAITWFDNSEKSDAMISMGYVG
ncbi:hypothetical protein RD1_0338 [Roseobacter denitrificans OCh 114]|uniref:Uncharacterized protein n=1 Tax=Roseobacter denitrificans (strain ATCC 33942 / OCh 114) TaxID=375451 RepID=Q16D82_ROSDO|nr:hypothetical protein RD1_0338 [Roseobacter denitrificans OCh 114]